MTFSRVKVTPFFLINCKITLKKKVISLSNIQRSQFEVHGVKAGEKKRRKDVIFKEGGFKWFGSLENVSLKCV